MSSGVLSSTIEKIFLNIITCLLHSSSLNLTEVGALGSKSKRVFKVSKIFLPKSCLMHFQKSYITYTLSCCSKRSIKGIFLFFSTQDLANEQVLSRVKLASVKIWFMNDSKFLESGVSEKNICWMAFQISPDSTISGKIIGSEDRLRVSSNTIIGICKIFSTILLYSSKFTGSRWCC